MSQSPTNNQPFDNPTSQSDRARQLREDRAVNTRAAMHSLLDPEPSGRWAKPVRVTGEYTVGSEEVPNYPRGNAPWQGPQPGLEPPFPVDISYVEPCGTDEEIARASAIAAELPIGPQLSPPDNEDALGFAPVAQGPAGSPPSRQQEAGLFSPLGSASAASSPTHAEVSRESTTRRDELGVRDGAAPSSMTRRFG
jgi:hypothetical protein